MSQPLMTHSSDTEKSGRNIFNLYEHGSGSTFQSASKFVLRGSTKVQAVRWR